MSILKAIFGAFGSTPENISVLDKKQYSSEIKKGKVQLLDVRTAVEYNSGHIKGAKNCDVMSSSFKNKLSKLDKTKPIYLYCQSGARSKTASKIISNEGFVQVYDLRGGYSAW